MIKSKLNVYTVHKHGHGHDNGSSCHLRMYSREIMCFRLLCLGRDMTYQDGIFMGAVDLDVGYVLHFSWWYLLLSDTFHTSFENTECCDLNLFEVTDLCQKCADFLNLNFFCAFLNFIQVM